jgi:replicative DNA helicase
VEAIVAPQVERAILATLLFAPACFEAFPELSPRDFATPEMAAIYSAMEQEVGRGRRPTTFAILPYLNRQAFGDRDVGQFLAALSRFSDPGALKSHIEAARVFAVRREMVDIARLLEAEAWGAETRLDHLAQDIMRRLDDVADARRSAGGQSMMFDEAADELLGSLDRDNGENFVSTGLSTLDRAIGGWPRGELTYLAGRPSMGKSALAFGSARQAAKRGANVLLFSLEMRREAVMARMLSDVAWSVEPGASVPYEDIIRRNISDRQRQRLSSLLGEVRGYPIRIDDTPGLSAAEIQLRARKFADQLEKAGATLDIVMVDHLGKVKASDRYAGHMTHETSEKSDAFMRFAKELNAAMVVLQQLNRGPEAREEKRPTQSDMRDSGSLEQDAHTVLFPYRPSYYLERIKFDDKDREAKRLASLEKCETSMEVIIGKNRNGKCGTIELYADMGSNAIRDKLSERHADSYGI